MRAWLVVLAVLFLASPAHGYTYESVVSSGCHEAITTEALRRMRATSTLLPPIVPDGEERALLDDLPFRVDEDMRDLGGGALLLGVRDNDLKGRGPAQLDQLAEVHGDPSSQREHCLRHPSDDEPEGSRAAIANCRSFIRRESERAIHAVGADGHPNPNARTDLRVTLDMRGGVDASLPAFYVHMGIALHTLQDSFTHTFRNGRGRITAVLNWVDLVEDRLEEARDGPPHMAALDRCDDADPLRTERHRLATEASTALLGAALAPGDAAFKLAAVDRVLDTYLTYEPGCTNQNQWCDAPENALRDPSPGCGCRTTRRSWASASLLVALSVGVVALLRRRRRGLPNLTRRVSTRILPGVLLALGVASVAPRRALAGDSLAEGNGAAQESPSRALPSYVEDRSRFGLYASLGGSIDHAAMATSIAGRMRVYERWLVGLDVEWNPWLSVQTQRARSGVLNIYGTAIRRWAMKVDQFSLRTTVHLGTSTALFHLYGVPTGTTGVYIGTNFLGLEWRVSRSVSLVVDPADVALPVPQLRGAPFGYLQYRFTIGIQYGG